MLKAKLKKTTRSPSDAHALDDADSDLNPRRQTPKKQIMLARRRYNAKNGLVEASHRVLPACLRAVIMKGGFGDIRAIV